MFFIQLRNELWKLFGKKRTYIGFGAFAIIQVLVFFIFRYGPPHLMFERMLTRNGYLPSEFISALTVALVMVTPQFIFLMPLYTTLVGGDIVAKEAEDGTLRMILSRPISRLRILWVKWATGVIFSTALVLALGLFALGIARMLFPWSGMFVLTPGQGTFAIFGSGEGLGRFALSHLFAAVNASATLTIAFMFSCFGMKPASATILALSYLFVNRVMEVIPFFDNYENWFITHHFNGWLLVFRNPIPWEQIAQSQIVIGATCLTAFIVGSIAFQVRDFKS